MSKLEQAARELLHAMDCRSLRTIAQKQAALQEALAEQSVAKFVPVGIVNDMHCITWIEGVVDDQAPVGAVLYAKEKN